MNTKKFTDQAITAKAKRAAASAAVAASLLGKLSKKV